MRWIFVVAMVVLLGGCMMPAAQVAPPACGKLEICHDGHRHHSPRHHDHRQGD